MWDLVEYKKKEYMQTKAAVISSIVLGFGIGFVVGGWLRPRADSLAQGRNTRTAALCPNCLLQV